MDHPRSAAGHTLFLKEKSCAFRGWGIVELDRVPTGDPLSPKDANESSLRFLREKFGVQA